MSTAPSERIPSLVQTWADAEQGVLIEALRRVADGAVPASHLQRVCARWLYGHPHCRPRWLATLAVWALRRDLSVVTRPCWIAGHLDFWAEWRGKRVR